MSFCLPIRLLYAYTSILSLKVINYSKEIPLGRSSAYNLAIRFHRYAQAIWCLNQTTYIHYACCEQPFKVWYLKGSKYFVLGL